MMMPTFQRFRSTASILLGKLFFGAGDAVGRGLGLNLAGLQTIAATRVAFASVFGLLIFKDALASFGSIWALQDSDFLRSVTLLWAGVTILLFAVSFLLKVRNHTLNRPALSALVFISFWLLLLGRVSFDGLPPVGFGLSVLLAICALTVGAPFDRLLRWTLLFLRSYVFMSLFFSALVSIFGLVGEERFGLRLLDFDYPLSGLASHPNGLALAAALGFILEFSHKRSLSGLGWTGMFGLALVLTYSFGSSIALVGSLGAIALFWTLDPEKKSKGIALGIAGVFLSAVVVGLMATQGRLNSLTSLTTGRISLWESLLPTEAVALFFGSGLSLFQSDFPNNAHNDLLQALSVGGLIALFLLLAAVALKVAEVGRLRAPVREPLSAVLTFALVLGLVEVPMTPSFSVSLTLIFLLWFSSYENPRNELAN